MGIFWHNYPQDNLSLYSFTRQFFIFLNYLPCKFFSLTIYSEIFLVAYILESSKYTLNNVILIFSYEISFLIEQRWLLKCFINIMGYKGKVMKWNEHVSFYLVYKNWIDFLFTYVHKDVLKTTQRLHNTDVNELYI